MKLRIWKSEKGLFDKLEMMSIGNHLSVVFETTTEIIELEAVDGCVHRSDIPERSYIELALKEKPIKAKPSKNPAAVYMEADQNS